MGAPTIPAWISRGKQRDDSNDILTPNAEYNEYYSEARLTQQVRWIKQNLGIGAILGGCALFLSALVAVVTLAGPAVRQGEINGSTTRAVEALGVAQRENREESAHALAEAVTRIETLVNKSVGIAEQTHGEMIAMRESNERKLSSLEDKQLSMWNWMVDLKSRVGMIEAEAKQKEKH
jgi:hypothetical protein